MATFHYRRRLTAAEQLPALGAALGAAVGAGAVVFYLARLMLQRTPLSPPDASGDQPAVAGPRAGRPLRAGAAALERGE